MELGDETRWKFHLAPFQWLALGFGLSFIHLFWYAHPATAWLGFICYTPFLVWLHIACKRPFIAGLVFGLWYSLMNMFWLGQFVGRWTSSVWIGGLVVLVSGLIWGCFYGTAATLTKLIQKKSTQLVAIRVSGVLFFLADLARTAIPQLEFPFTMLGDPVVAYPIVCFFSTYQAITTLFVVVINCTLVEILREGRLKKHRIETAIWLILGGLFVAQGVTRYVSRPASLNIRVALGQLGFDMAYGDPQLEYANIRDAANALIQRARQEKCDLLILPEAVATFEVKPNTPFDLPRDLNILFGAARGTTPRYQSAYLWNGDNFTHTDKNRLVVFGEYVPFRGIIPYPAGFQLPSGDLAPGEARTVLQLKPDVKIGGIICFESLFASAGWDVANKGADLIAVMSLDDWYIGTSAISRLAVAARWRAVETNKWVLRVGSLGKTMVISPKGEIAAELPEGGRELLIVNL